VKPSARGGSLLCVNEYRDERSHSSVRERGAHPNCRRRSRLTCCGGADERGVLRLSPSPAETKIIGSVNISAQELSALRDDIANLKNDIQKLSNSKVSEDGFKLLEEKVAKIDAKLSELQKTKQPSSTKAVKPARYLRLRTVKPVSVS